MHTGLNQSNVIAVVANGGTLDVYVNNQKVDRINDNTYSEGQIGVFAGSTNNSAEVTFNDARVWVL